MQAQIEDKGMGPGDDKRTVTIVVNGRQKTVSTKTLSFWEVIQLAFENPAPGPQIFFTVAYRKGPDKKPKGTLVEGDSVHLKDGMVFDVTRTDRS
jgi:hypothetical protein